jgi:hypothetical protein
MKKSLSFALIVLLSLSLLATPGLSYSDCGKNCCCSSNMTAMHPTVLQPAQMKGNCCSEAAALTCSLKKSQDFELPMCALSAARAETNSSADSAPFIKSPFYSDIGFKRHRMWLSANTFLQSSPIYLQHFSLLI